MPLVEPLSLPCEVISPVRDRVGESPVWSVREQALYWVDIESQAIRRWSPANGSAKAQVATWLLPERVGCIALTHDGRVIAAMESRIVAATLGQGGAINSSTLAVIDHPVSGMRFNDGKCDAAGRLWLGTMVMNMGLNSGLGALYCLDERGLTGPYVHDLLTPNGLGFSPDGRVMYLSDSHPTVQKIWAFDFDVKQGTLTNRRLFVDMNGHPGRPDGAAVDAAGNYWICGNDAGQIHCFSPAGALLQSLSVPFPKPAMGTFGGAALDTLFVTSIPPVDAAQDLLGLSGRLIALQPKVLGRAEPFFSQFPSR
jgi:sugar lactone lactonase YvrE